MQVVGGFLKPHNLWTLTDCGDKESGRVSRVEPAESLRMIGSGSDGNRRNYVKRV